MFLTASQKILQQTSLCFLINFLFSSTKLTADVNISSNPFLVNAEHSRYGTLKSCINYLLAL